ncbi:19207_t:CDS:2 [Dentiscutata erythropus]|uniref:19207_t:CDS:1 n=1 Tax=Dentiscutata erythropus TaxID=1348616 RepID=A0A9N9BHQ1_9GLOM|nr:19207_t:CDS:2 [Dentiscutata erythropus]
MGGISPSNSISGEVFYLDLSSPPDIDNLSFIDLTNTSPMLYGISKGAALASGIGKSYIILIGGTQQDINMPQQNITDQFVFVYNVHSQNWEIVQGAQPTRRSSISTVIDQFASDTNILYNELYSFDTSTLLWGNLSGATNAPMPRSHATATLLPDGKIIYIGGVIQQSFENQTTLQNMLQIFIYDTQFLGWSAIKANASFVVQPRMGHTAVLTSDNKSIILLGGISTLHDEINQIAADPNFLVLKIESGTYEYLAPQLSGNQPPKLSYHTANLYVNHMIVTFGNYSIH